MTDFSRLKYISLVFGLLLLISASATAKDILIYHDADYSVNSVSAKSMKMGFLTALDEIGNDFSGHKLRFVEKNHRGNIKRSYRNMTQFLDSDDALFVLGGLHSPPYIKNREFINKNEVLLLVPWAAGGPITRYPSADNWVFRLSIDDTKAGLVLGEFAEKTLKCKKPHLLLENTPWGKSNFNTVTSYYKDLKNLSVTWFDWNTKISVAKIKLREAITNNADCLIFVANYAETKEFFKAMLSFPKSEQIPFVSHWGFTGGDIDQLLNNSEGRRVDLSFLQTCYSFSTDKTDKGSRVLARARKLFPDNELLPNNIQAPAGFIHGYDLGKLAFTALKSIDLSGNMKEDRAKLKVALESPKLSVSGLIKHYEQPFSTWSVSNSDAHEALGLEDFCIANFDANNQIIVETN